ncbi:MAG: 16S rRNA (cytosine(967)-C(5))-methyltransferase RsmB [Actinomycetota bacterium]|nr:16S rRNA (cytosine(967)-C(5))-methyltransferase RsmB [Actinomycetota bacterium]
MNEKKNEVNPRKIAFLILAEYFKKKKSLKDILNYHIKDYKLSSRDRRFIFNIVKGTVRYYLRIDFVLSLFSNKKIKKIDFEILIILRMGIFQLMYMSKVPYYSAVNESVKLAAEIASIPSSKFVNAVLRNVSSIKNINLFADKKIEELYCDEIDKISIKYSYPDWLVKYWASWYGIEKTVLICKSLNKNPRNYLRINRSKITMEDLLKELDRESFQGKPVDLSTGEDKKQVTNTTRGVCYNNEFFQKNIFEDTIEVASVQNIARIDAYIKGLMSIQDISSQIAVKYFLQPCTGEKVLDVCAAPGSKTTYISELIGDNGKVISVDISKKRLELLKENLVRLNKKNVLAMEADATEKDFLEKGKTVWSISLGNKEIIDDYAGYFDRIFIDAPCSAFGTISKNPDVKYNKTMDDIIRLAEMSYKIIVNCDKYLKNGGRLVFYTCTLSPIENQQMIDKFLKEFNEEYDIIKPDIFGILISTSGLKEDLTYLEGKEDGYFEIMPYHYEGEGGFVCSLKKKL